MRVSFIGCPCSGKTTTAAMTVARLKETGIGCEFIVEQARLYIAEKRRSLGLRPGDKLVLDEADQLAIMQRQLHVEDLMSEVVGEDVIVVSDSSPLNSLLYMEPSAREGLIAAKMINRAVASADLVFYVPPVQHPQYLDPNRIHDQAASFQIDVQIPEVMNQLAPSVWNKVERISGDPQSRLNQVSFAILQHRLA